jgi:hypothetical protein
VFNIIFYVIFPKRLKMSGEGENNTIADSVASEIRKTMTLKCEFYSLF